jgi:hypothetical protein
MQRQTLLNFAFLIAMLFALAPLSAHAQDIFVTQYVETESGTTPKGVELINNTGALIDFSVTPLIFEVYVNGNSSPTTQAEVTSGTLGDLEVIVVGGDDLATYMAREKPGVLFVNDSFSFNGDDAIEVLLDGVRQDVIGQIGTDPGSAWEGNGVSTAGQNIAIQEGIATGDKNGSDPYDPSTRFTTLFDNPTGSDNTSLQDFGDVNVAALPVEFAGPPLAAADGNAVTVRWTTYSEENNLGFYIQHQRAGQSGWTEAQQRVDGAGTTTARNDYDYTVRDLSPGPYTFRVRQVDTDATESFSQTVEATVTAEGFTLQAPRQNPFQGRTELTYADEGAQNVQAALYNSLGQRVRTLRPASGVIAVEAGSLASGLYFVRLTDGAGRVAVQSVTLVR